MKKKALILFLCVSSAWITACNHKKPAKPIPVPAMKVDISTISKYKNYIGITQSIAAVGIRARVEGFLEQMLFVEGGPVKKGELLFVIDQKPFQAKLDMAKGHLTKAIADRDYQQVQFLRMKELVKKGDVSQTQYDMTAAQFQAAKGEVEITQSQVEEASINLGYCSMYSPVKGIISKKYVDVGNLVGGTEHTLLANVVQLDPMYVQFSPSVNDFSEFLKYRENMPFKVKASLAQNDKLLFHGKVDLVNNEADIPTSTILMRALIDNPQNLLLPGIYVNISVLLSDHDKVILVPATAVVEAQELLSVFVVNAENLVEVRAIETDGQYQQQYIVKSGLNVGDIVITSGMQKLRPGTKVSPQLTAQKHG